jgi:hypothetical protein
MDFYEKARIRITTWMEHNKHHQEEYELFADQLEQEGKIESALRIREMAALTVKSNASLTSALKSLEKDE